MLLMFVQKLKRLVETQKEYAQVLLQHQKAEDAYRLGMNRTALANAGHLSAVMFAQRHEDARNEARIKAQLAKAGGDPKNIPIKDIQANINSLDKQIKEYPTTYAQLVKARDHVKSDMGAKGKGSRFNDEALLNHNDMLYYEEQQNAANEASRKFWQDQLNRRVNPVAISDNTQPLQPQQPDQNLSRILHQPMIQEQPKPGLAQWKKLIPTTTQATTSFDYSTQSQLQKAHIANISSKQNKHPLQSDNELDRQAGVYAKSLRLLDGKKFKALPEANKQLVLRDYYKKYVAPAYYGSQLAAPDEDTWVKGMAVNNYNGPTMAVSNFYLNRGAPDAVEDFESSALNMGATASKVIGNVIHGLGVAGMKASIKTFGLQAYFNGPQYEPSETMADVNPKGLVEKGNLPIWNRPTVQNADGSHSSEYSTSFEDEHGHEILVPTVVNGKFLTPDGKKPKEGSPEEKAMFKAAQEHYEKTGENLGKFSDYRAADAYSEKLHSRGERPDPYSWKAYLADAVRLDAESPIMKTSQDLVDNAAFFLASRPSKTFSEMAGSFVGEQAIQLPLYEAIGTVRTLGAAATGLDKVLKVGATAEDAGAFTRAANFSRRLAASPTGRAIGRRLGEAMDAYIGATVQQADPEQRRWDIATFMALGPIGEGLGKLAKPIGRGIKSGMKKAMAEQIAIGGLPFAESIRDQAAHELEHNIIGTDHNGQPLIIKPEHTQADVVEGIKIAEQADPIKHNLVTATKLQYQQIAKELYGENAVYRNLGKTKRNAVRAELEKRGAQATEEIPIHLPEVAQHEIEKEIKEDIQLSPKLAQTYAEIEQLFPVKVADAVAKQERETVKAETGLSSVQGAVQKVAKKTEAVAKAKAAGAPRVGPRTKEDEIFTDFSDFGTSKYNFKDESFNLQFASKADRALYNTRKTPLQYGGMNKPVPQTYHSTKAKLKQHFAGKTDQDLQRMSNEVKAKVDKAVKERMAHPEYKAGTMKYGANIKIDPIHGTSAPKVEKSIASVADKKKELLEVSKEQIKEYGSELEAFKANHPEAYQQGLKILAELQSMAVKLEMLK